MTDRRRQRSARSDQAERPSPEPIEPGSERYWLARHAVSPRKHLGQNFLLDQQLIELIVERGAVRPGDVVVEVGPGGGALTHALLRAGATVFAIEKDLAVAPLLEERFRDEITAGRLSLRFEDVLAVPLEVLPPRASLFGNLPYSITTPILEWAGRRRDRFSRAVVMIQREVGERILASPGGKEYGSLTVFLGAQAECRALVRVGPAAFWPRPAVDSMVLELRFVEPPPWSGEIARLERVLRAAFGQRRKTLENALAHGLGSDKEAIRTILLELGLDPGARAERISIEQFGRLTNRLFERLPIAIRGAEPESEA
ncbi:MAG: ribosomal RNA small subunit methyltransferase A [Candidatus Eisenbacteria bacterium]|nr:ribosomal RNA small subunit methyltransferase A [Candidatus Eisenbacteria bacterium]